MSEYTSTKEGFQKAMEISLNGKPEDAQKYTDATSTETFYHLFNGKREDREHFTRGVAEWRGKITDYVPVVSVLIKLRLSKRYADPVQT